MMWLDCCRRKWVLFSGGSERKARIGGREWETRISTGGIKELCAESSLRPCWQLWEEKRFVPFDFLSRFCLSHIGPSVLPSWRTGAPQKRNYSDIYVICLNVTCNAKWWCWCESDRFFKTIYLHSDVQAYGFIYGTLWRGNLDYIRDGRLWNYQQREIEEHGLANK